MDGLSGQEASRRLREFGWNELAPKRPTSSAFAWIVRLVADPMVVLLAIAGATYLALGDRFDATITIGALVPIFLVSAILEYRSDRALDRLRDLSAPTARVVRDGIETTIPARDVVPGDLVLLREGDIVPADGTVASCVHLSIDESSLTGESFPVDKDTQQHVLAGTTVRSGRGTFVVDVTGLSTEYGKVAEKLTQLRNPPTPIEQAIHRIVFQFGAGVLVLCAGIILITRAHGELWSAAIIAGVSLAMAAIPEEFPMVYTLYLALGAWRLARDRALVRKLGSVEALGAVTVICVDKTGTITFGALELTGRIAAPGVSAAELDEALAWSCDPNSGDPIDEAIASAAGVLTAGETIREIPFDPARRYSGRVVRVSTGEVTALKGAPDAIFARCEHVPEGLISAAEDLAKRGSRVLAVSRDGDAAGIVGFADPVRPDARIALGECRRAGVRTIMITGDHAATALAVASEIELTNNPKRIVEGKELDAIDDLELQRRIDGYDVIARARPEHKLRIVEALHARGAIVAMTGDGTNDALALRASDIGIALGKRGTAVAREAADLVLLDDDFSTIVHAIEDGRRIFHNLRHAFTYLTSFHVPLLLSAIVIPLVGAPLILMPVHLVWLELIVHPTSALVFENDPADADIMTQGPRKPGAPILAAHDWARTLTLGIGLSAVVLALYLTLLRAQFPDAEARAAAIIAMIVGQMTLVFAERSGYRPMWQTSIAGNRSILPVLLGTLMMLLAAVYIGGVAAALHLAPPPWNVAATAAGLGFLSVLCLQVLAVARASAYAPEKRLARK